MNKRREGLQWALRIGEERPNVVSWIVLTRARQTPRREMGEDQRWVLGLKRVVIEAAALEALEPHVCDEHVGLGQQLLQDLQPSSFT